MNLSELRAEVVTLTNRADLDLTGQILLAVRRATLKLHTIDYFYKDLSEFTVAFSSSISQQAFDTISNVPRWRSAKYFRFYDLATATPGKFFKKLDSQNVLDDYGVSSNNIWYQAGDILQLRYEANFQYMLAGVYLYPDIAAATYTSWIAVSYPYAIVLEASAMILKMTGKADEARMIREDNNENIALLKISGIQENPEVNL